MSTYIILSNLTDEGAKTLKHNPERIKEVNKEFEALGVKVLSQYAVLGPYDFVNIVEGPDNIQMARIASELSSRGSVRVMTMAAIPIDEFIGSFQEKSSAAEFVTSV
ncbi:GYD domain-containing protein [Pleurocapsales cyanobacterium LEGE 06147]|nr:GYD domain-containing protein [Pleurocapsales cyanobacterium LEGE 06147]